MSDIVFTTPPVTVEERYSNLLSADNTLPSLCILYLASVLRKVGYSKEIFRKFYLRPRIVLNYMKTITENPKGLPYYLKGLIAFLKEIIS